MLESRHYAASISRSGADVKLFVVSALLFVGGIVFIVAGARSARRTPASPAAAAVPMAPVATVKQIMNAIVAPATDTVFGAVKITMSAKGTEVKAPQTPAEWDAVANAAAAIVESGNLMLMDGRLVDRGDWIKMTRGMIDGGKVMLKAAQSKNADDVLAAGEAVNNSCDNCHQKYQRAQ